MNAGTSIAAETIRDVRRVAFWGIAVNVVLALIHVESLKKDESEQS